MREAKHLIFDLNDPKNPLTKFPKYELDIFEELYEVYLEIYQESILLIMESQPLNLFENVPHMSQRLHRQDIAGFHPILVRAFFELYCKNVMNITENVSLIEFKLRFRFYMTEFGEEYKTRLT